MSNDLPMNLFIWYQKIKMGRYLGCSKVNIFYFLFLINIGNSQWSVVIIPLPATVQHDLRPASAYDRVF